MTQPALPQQVLLAQANALGVAERALPFPAPPISQSLVSLATTLPLGSLPALPVLGQGGLFPTLPATPFSPQPLGDTSNILAALLPNGARAPTPPTPPNRRGPAVFARTGLG